MASAADVMLRMRLGDEMYLPRTAMGQWEEKLVLVPP